MGVTAEVFSGGQAAKGSGGPRTGSTRHDHGQAADVRFYQGDRQLDWSNRDDLPVFAEIVQRGKEAGLTGFGAGPGYMSEGSMHVGFGSPGVWGAGGKRADAPDWLVSAYGEAPTSDGTVSGSGGQEMAYGSGGNDDLMANPMPTNPGGLGGLGGFLQSDGFGDFLSAAGASMMSSPSNNWFSNFDTALQSRQTNRFRKEALEEARAEKTADRQALETVLRSQGFNADEARAYSGNASAANLAIAGREKTVAQETGNRTADILEAEYPDIAEAIRSKTMSGLEGWKMAEDRKTAARKAQVGDGRFSTQPQYFRRPDGSTGIGQLGSNGEMIETQVPDGYQVLSPYDISLDRARGGATGKMSGEALGALPQAEGTVARVQQQVKDLKEDPYLPKMVGAIDGRLPNWSSDAVRVQGKMDQLQSGAFLEARQALKGGGAITDFESQKAEAAYLRANAAQSEADYKDALDEFSYYTDQGLSKLRQQAGVASPAAAPAPGNTSDPLGVR